jgi:hypothetical protein
MRWTETPFVLALAAAFVVGWFAVDIFGGLLFLLAVFTMIGG